MSPPSPMVMVRHGRATRSAAGWRAVKNAEHGFRPLPGLTVSPNYHDILREAAEFLNQPLKTRDRVSASQGANAAQPNR